MRGKTQTVEQSHVARSDTSHCKPGDLQRHSAAYTLSDLELLVYPELLFGLVLANVMSPRIWSWRNDPWFDGIDDSTPYRRILRLKQYIVDRYAFNLDLGTWGLTTKGQELARFQHLLDEKDLCRLSPFFGCAGDHHYFEQDIRNNFGLQDFPEEVIPYWKTETVEAMDAFRYRRDDNRGAGECVSFAALYCAALYIIAGIPLEKLFILVTPLHCQVFVDVDEGLLTNNRRMVTKHMWFNGSELSRRARQSLENEQVVLVAHVSGLAHLLYENTIDANLYDRFKDSLASYLRVPLTAEIFENFLRQDVDFQKYFQLRSDSSMREGYLPLERAFEEEKASSYRLTDRTRKKLLDGLDRSHFSDRRLANRILVNDVEDFLASDSIDLNSQEDCRNFTGQFCIEEGTKIIRSLRRFGQTIPKLPDNETRSVPRCHGVSFPVGLSRTEILSQLRAGRSRDSTIDAAFSIYRDLNQINLESFVLAAVERNPVSVHGAIQLFGSRQIGTSRLCNAMRSSPASRKLFKASALSGFKNVSSSRTTSCAAAWP